MFSLIKIIFSLVPVFTFLLVLVLMDSFKLVKQKEVFISILAGCIAALFAMVINSSILLMFNVERTIFTRYIAPVIEEVIKASYIFFLIHRHKTGFLVDSAIHGFSIGAGFAFIENIYYLNSIPSMNLLLWIIRGFGTAVMHGGTTAIFAIITKAMVDRKKDTRSPLIMPGIILAIFIHGLFNHFLLPPAITTMIQLALLPAMMLAIFRFSEKKMREWMDLSLDTDVQMISFIEEGGFSQTIAGKYLQTLKKHFTGEVVADMFCLLRLHLELSCQAKGILLRKEMGFPVSNDPEISEKLTELAYLQKNIGKTGRLAISPILRNNPRDLWEIQLLQNF